MTQKIALDPDDRADRAHEDGVHEVARDLALQRLAIVNVAYYGIPDSPSGKWVLIDAGLIGTVGMISRAAAKRFGAASRPAAIILTHGHFDHVGALEDLAEEWDVPVYAHEMEAPYLTGGKSYPPPDPQAGGGLMALSSSLFPRAPVNVGRRLRLLPDDGTVPSMPEWR